MTTVIGGSSPSITFSDSTTQSTAALPLTGGSLTGNIISTGSISSVNTFGFKNRIINGAMVIDQRNAGASVTQGTSNIYTVDRFYVTGSVTSKFTAQQNAGSVTPPSGFTNYLGMTSSSAYSVGSTDFFICRQAIEGFNTADLAWGTASAATVTLSFRVYSSLTGTFGGCIQNAALNRNYPFTYTISSANTWTTISVTIAGDTSGTWVGASNAASLLVTFSLGAGATYTGTSGAWTATPLAQGTGATSVVGTNGATFYITGVQLEVGSTATSFDYRPYGTEFALCQRYYEQSYDYGTVAGTSTGVGAVRNNGSNDGAGNGLITIFFKVTKRSTPTITAYSQSGTSGVWNYANSASASGTSTVNTNNTSTSAQQLYLSAGSAWLTSNIYGHYTASSEL